MTPYLSALSTALGAAQAGMNLANNRPVQGGLGLLGTAGSALNLASQFPSVQAALPSALTGSVANALPASLAESLPSSLGNLPLGSALGGAAGLGMGIYNLVQGNAPQGFTGLATLPLAFMGPVGALFAGGMGLLSAFGDSGAEDDPQEVAIKHWLENNYLMNEAGQSNPLTTGVIGDEHIELGRNLTLSDYWERMGSIPLIPAPMNTADNPWRYPGWKWVGTPQPAATGPVGGTRTYSWPESVNPYTAVYWSGPTNQWRQKIDAAMHPLYEGGGATPETLKSAFPEPWASQYGAQYGAALADPTSTYYPWAANIFKTAAAGGDLGPLLTAPVAKRTASAAEMHDAVVYAIESARNRGELPYGVPESDFPTYIRPSDMDRFLAARGLTRPT